jgi:hypothetical protein
MKHCLQVERIKYKKFKMEPPPDDTSENNFHIINGVVMQHFISSLIATPACLGIGGLDTKLAFALVRHGALMEMGWEIGDFIKMFYFRMFVKDGKKKIPNVIVIFGLLHHSMCCTMCLPMNLYHGELYEYAEILVLMQGAAAIGVGLAQFG